MGRTAQWHSVERDAFAIADMSQDTGYRYLSRQIWSISGSVIGQLPRDPVRTGWLAANKELPHLYGDSFKPNKTRQSGGFWGDVRFRLTRFLDGFAKSPRTVKDGQDSRSDGRDAGPGIPQRRRLLRPSQPPVHDVLAHRVRRHRQHEAVRRWADQLLGAGPLHGQPRELRQQLLLGAEHLLPVLWRVHPPGARERQATHDPLLPVDADYTAPTSPLLLHADPRVAVTQP